MSHDFDTLRLLRPGRLSLLLDPEAIDPDISAHDALEHFALLIRLIVIQGRSAADGTASMGEHRLEFANLVYFRAVGRAIGLVAAVCQERNVLRPRWLEAASRAAAIIDTPRLVFDHGCTLSERTCKSLMTIRNEIRAKALLASPEAVAIRESVTPSGLSPASRLAVARLARRPSPTAAGTAATNRPGQTRTVPEEHVYLSTLWEEFRAEKSPGRALWSDFVIWVAGDELADKERLQRFRVWKWKHPSKNALR